MTVEQSPETWFRDDDQSTRNPMAEFVRTTSVQFHLWVALSDNPDETRSCFFQPDPWTVPGPVLQFESSTSVDAQQAQALDREVETIVSLATEENMEDGMDSDTEVRLGRFIASHSIAGVQRLSARLASGCTNTGTAADIVRVLGRIDHEESHDDRLWIATRMLRSDAPLARDAGAVALEDLGDPRAVRVLQEAVNVETIPELRADIEMALEELARSTDGVHSSET